MGWVTTANVSPQVLKKRLPVAALVLVLHIGFIAVLLFQKIAPAIVPQESIITLPVLPRKKAVAMPPPQASGAALKKSYGTFTPPREFPQATPDLSGLSFLLRKCGVSASPSIEDRSRCRPMGSIAFGDVREDFSGVSKAKHAEQYAAEVKEKNAPFRVPCTYIMIPEDGATPAVMVHPICAMETIAETVDRIRRGDY